jgi:hypothetical protein
MQFGSKGIAMPGNRGSAGKAQSQADKLLDALFAADGARLSLRECYVACTGDYDVTGDFSRCDPVRLRESFGEEYVEALTTASWAVALGTAVERRVHAEMENMQELQAWRKIATVTSVASFKPQHGLRIGGYGSLSEIGEGEAYPPLSGSPESGGSYSVSKRGGVESITLEMVANDDISAVRRIPTEMALASSITLFEFVFDLIRDNPVMSDDLPLFDAAHGNIGSTAFGVDSYFAASAAISKQERPGSGKRIGFGRKVLLVPLELQQVAYAEFVKGQTEAALASGLVPDVVTVPHWTDPNDWALVVDPAYFPSFEVGFLGGRELPEVVVSDEPNSGSLFSNDKITYKVKHVYGGVPLGFQGVFKSVVS